MGVYQRAKAFIGKRLTNLKMYAKDSFTTIPQLYREQKFEYPPSVSNFLLQYGDATIEDMYVYRTPVSENIDNTINALSAGKWKDVKNKLGYDKFFHLSLVFKANGVPVIYEKNTSVNISTAVPNLLESEKMPVPFPLRLTIHQFVDRAHKYMGPSFFTYDAFNNNCQNFILGSLVGNGLLNDKLKDFIYQDISSLIKEQPSYLQPVVKAFTDIGGLADRFLQKRFISLDDPKQQARTEDTPNTFG